MRVRKISATSSTPFDLKAFSQELRELSDRYGIRLVSMGAMSGLDSGAKGTTYLAILGGGAGCNAGRLKEHPTLLRLVAARWTSIEAQRKD